jgi:hypothetical protein
MVPQTDQSPELGVQGGAQFRPVAFPGVASNCPDI